MDNIIITKNHYGMRIVDLVNGVIKGNRIYVHDFSSDGAGIRLSYHADKSFGTGTISVEDNNIIVSGSASTKDAFYIRKASSGGSGSITIQIEGNKVHAASKFVRTNIADILSPIIGKNNYYSVNDGTLVSDEGTVKTKLMVNSGTATFSGDASTTDFNIPHNMRQAPTIVHLEAKTSDAAGDKYWEADNTNITVHFITAPPTGDNNVILSWRAEV